MEIRKLVLAIDFDGTIAEEKWPEVGELRYEAKKYINQLHQDGHKIVINTCRSGVYEGMAEQFLLDNAIAFDYINCNLPEKILEFKQDCRKISADIYIDDKCIGGLPSWKEIYRIIQKRT